MMQLLSETHGILFAIFYGLLGWHCWLKRKGIQQLGKWVVTTLPGAFRSPLGLLSQWLVGDVAAQESELGAVRVQGFKLAADAVSCLAALGLVAASLVRPHFLESGAPQGYNLAYLLGIPVYGLCLLVSCELMPLTPQRVAALYVALNACMMVGTLAMQPDPLLDRMSNAKLLIRGALALGVLDSRVSAPTNAVWAALHLFERVRAQDTWRLLALCFGLELVTCAALEALAWLGVAVASTRGSARGSADSTCGSVSGSVQQAVLSLLSVLCDADLLLTPSLQIQEPSQKVAHLLREDVAKLASRSIMDFVSDGDRERFEGFLRAGAPSARLLQVQLCDANGQNFPAQIFHTSIPSEGDGAALGHLMGVRDCAPACREVAFGGPTVPVIVPGSLNMLPPQEQGTWADSQFAPCPAVHDDVGSSTSSRRAKTLETVVHRLELPEVERLEIRFDPLHEDLLVKEFRICWKPNPDCDGRQQQLPRLLEWIAETMRTPLRDWLQTQYLAAVYGPEMDRSFGPLAVHWPCPDDEPEDAWHAAESLIRFPELDDDSGSEDEDDEDEDNDESGERPQGAEGDQGADTKKGGEKEDHKAAGGKAQKAGAVDDDATQAVLTLHHFHQMSVRRNTRTLTASLGRSSHASSHSARYSVRSGRSNRSSALSRRPTQQMAVVPESGSS